MEPERPIEKLLQAVAKKRREQAGQPFELHPAARQELLREASRRAAKKSSGGFFAHIFSGFGPRLALALSTVVILVAGIWIARPLLNGKKNISTVAMADRPAARPANELAPALAPPPVSASPTVAGSAESTLAEAAPSTTDARRSAGEISAEAKAEHPTPQIAAVHSAQSLKDEANRKLKSGAESSTPVGAAQPSVALEDLSKSTVAVASTPPSPPAAIYQNTRAADSFAAGNTAYKAAAPTAPSVATNAVAAPMTFASADRATQQALNVLTPPASANNNPAANFDANEKNQIAGNPVPMSQRFYRVVAVPTVRQRGFGGGSAVAPLLASFQMEQNGQEIRVVDADGSVYTGSWQVVPEQNATAAPAGRAGSLHISGAIPAVSGVRPAPTPAINNNFQAMQNYSFSVTGTNRTLKQRITFSGNLIPVANISNSANNAGAINGFVEGRNTPNAAQPVLLNSRIAGKAIIGDQKEIEVNANPAP